MEYILTDKMREWAKVNGFDAEVHVEWWNDYLANKTGKPYKDLDAAFRNCVRSDWGGMRRLAQQQAKAKNGNGYISDRDASRRRAYEKLTGKSANAIEGVSTRID